MDNVSPLAVNSTGDATTQSEQDRKEIVQLVEYLTISAGLGCIVLISALVCVLLNKRRGRGRTRTCDKGQSVDKATR